MFEILLPVIVGGLIAIAGGVVQAILSSKNSLKQQRIAKREEAYLEFIDALLRVTVDYQFNEVNSNGFWTILKAANAKLNLYGSKKIIELSQEFQAHLEDCYDNHWDRGTEAKKWELIEAIRKELRIEE